MSKFHSHLGDVPATTSMAITKQRLPRVSKELCKNVICWRRASVSIVFLSNLIEINQGQGYNLVQDRLTTILASYSSNVCSLGDPTRQSIHCMATIFILACSCGVIFCEPVSKF